jgi:hypothetical protein
LFHPTIALNVPFVLGSAAYILQAQIAGEPILREMNLTFAQDLELSALIF